MKQIKIEWCENFVKATFKKYSRIEVNCFWNMAERSGLWVRKTYNTPMTKALEKLTEIEDIRDDKENYLYSIFKLKEDKQNV